MFTKYNAKDSSVLVNGVYVTGLAEDFWAFEKSEAVRELVVGAHGDVVSNEKNDPIWEATVTVQTTSPQAKMLFGLMKVNEPFPIWCINKALGRREGGTMALMTEAPADEHGTEAGELEFKFAVIDGDIITE